jgi:hypothetical protein
MCSRRGTMSLFATPSVLVGIAIVTNRFSRSPTWKISIDLHQGKLWSAPRGASECPVLAHRAISWRRSNSVALGAKRTFSEQRLSNRIYENAPPQAADRAAHIPR